MVRVHVKGTWSSRTPEPWEARIFSADAIKRNGFFPQATRQASGLTTWHSLEPTISQDLRGRNPVLVLGTACRDQETKVAQ